MQEPLSPYRKRFCRLHVQRAQPTGWAHVGLTNLSRDVIWALFFVMTTSSGQEPCLLLEGAFWLRLTVAYTRQLFWQLLVLRIFGLDFPDVGCRSQASATFSENVTLLVKISQKKAEG